MSTLLLVILFVSVLILVHEWGHFYAARALGVRVDEFGFGFPPRVVSWMRGGVRYSLNALPLGGFVKIYGEQGEGENDGASFAARSARVRFTILFAGIFMNILLAWIFFSVGAAAGVPSVGDLDDTSLPVSVTTVAPGSPAERAGLRFGDQILELRAADGHSLRVEQLADIRTFADAYKGEEIILAVRRGDVVREVRVTPRTSYPDGEGPLGIALDRITIVRILWYRAPIAGAETLWRGTMATAVGLTELVKKIFVRTAAPLEVSGPVGIYFLAQDTRMLGLSYFLQFLGVLSLNLGILNFLPIPALDGGRILFLLVEKIKGSRVNPHVEGIIHTVGFFVLIVLMIVVTYKDVIKFF
ncbi:MAG: M50 family metallopeptidase [bacterium]|nr:M50 family metallopeptidase [bacterium]MDZ4299779.1 M50 family metallopeptidase [Candidatus Sungbacteria bacterium]